MLHFLPASVASVFFFVEGSLASVFKKYNEK